AEGNAAGWQSLAIVLRVLMHDIAPTFPAETSHISNVHRITAAFVVDVGENRVFVFGLRVELICDGNIERAFAGEIPTAVAMGLAEVRKARTVSSLVGEPR